jgi:hypothetical protein
MSKETKQKRKMLLDKTGREIFVGDVLQIFHFTAALRREKHYMYKYVAERITTVSGKERFKILHMEKKLTSFYVEAINGRQLMGVEIVQGYGGVPKGRCFKDRPKHHAPARRGWPSSIKSWTHVCEEEAKVSCEICQMLNDDESCPLVKGGEG